MFYVEDLDILVRFFHLELRSHHERVLLTVLSNQISSQNISVLSWACYSILRKQVAAADDSNIYIWGFDEQAMNELRDSAPGTAII